MVLPEILPFRVRVVLVAGEIIAPELKVIVPVLVLVELVIKVPPAKVKGEAFKLPVREAVAAEFIVIRVVSILPITVVVALLPKTIFLVALIAPFIVPPFKFTSAKPFVTLIAYVSPVIVPVLFIVKTLVLAEDGPIHIPIPVPVPVVVPVIVPVLLIVAVDIFLIPALVEVAELLVIVPELVISKLVLPAEIPIDSPDELCVIIVFEFVTEVTPLPETLIPLAGPVVADAYIRPELEAVLVPVVLSCCIPIPAVVPFAFNSPVLETLLNGTLVLVPLLKELSNKIP